MSERIVRDTSKPPKRGEHGLDGGTQSRVRASEGVVTNINAIMRQLQRTGVVSHINQRVPQYGDFSMSQTLHEALTNVLQAEEAFQALPAQVRAAADNDVVRFWEMLGTEEETELLVAAGLEEPERFEDVGEQPTPATPPAEPEGEA